MIKRILIILFICMIFALIALWFIIGGAGRISRAAHSLGNPIDLIIGSGTIAGGSIRLPWQPNETTQGPDISNYAVQATDQVDQSNQYDAQSIPDIQNKTDVLRKNINEAKTFGDPSPYKGEVTLTDRQGSEGGDVRDEYITLSASTDNTAPISITGWYLQSVLTNTRVPLPPASSLFILGVVNPVNPVSLNPGQSAIIASGVSPVGVSFRENACSGYLAQFQTFAPDLENACPDPSNALPQIPENLQRYGATCFTYVQALPSCRFPGNILPSDLSMECKMFITNTYSYNGCVNTYQFRTDFKKDSWRLFLQSSHPLWNNSHDIIRLLDAQGRTVDVLTY